MGVRKRLSASIFVFILVMGLFLFTASIEYSKTYDNHVKEVQDQLTMIKLNLENLITSRMIALNGLKAHAEIDPFFTQEDYTYFAKGIYDSASDAVQSMTFITDTTITHIYPYEPYKSVIGIDLGVNDEQNVSIQYVKDNLKTLLIAPVNLVEGGLGIITRIPVVNEDAYFGQITIIFDYEKTLALSGIMDLSETHLIEWRYRDVLKDKDQVIWSNFESIDRDESQIQSAEVALYESSMFLFALPKGGFEGKSTLFYLILGMGLLISIISSFVIYRLLTTTDALAISESELMENNEELEALVNQLKANEEELYDQYDEISRQKDQIQALADRDYLTNLYNRRRYAMDLGKSIGIQKAGTLLLFDIDNFKNINDTQGHKYGDKVLIHIASVLEKSVCQDASIYRIGGDEFAIHLPDMTSNSDVESCIQSFFEALHAENSVENIENHITASVGISQYPVHASTADDLLMKADIAMYEAKKEGKNRFCYFTEALTSNFDYAVNVEKELRSALEEQRFVLFYQAIVSAEDGDVVSYEALLRIEASSLSPVEFIPIAESSGLIVPIGFLIVEEVCRKLNKWRENGVLLKPIAINISAKQLYDNSLVLFIKTCLKRYDLPAYLLEIEVTESVLIENSGYAIQRLEALRAEGISISLDDFGTGYSSLSYLTYMPVDKVKIDKGLKDKFLFLENSAVMKNLISICHDLNLKVVTEGVETEAEYQRLKSFGSDLIQGYYFDKPGPIGDGGKMDP